MKYKSPSYLKVFDAIGTVVTGALVIAIFAFWVILLVKLFSYLF